VLSRSAPPALAAHYALEDVDIATEIYLEFQPRVYERSVTWTEHTGVRLRVLTTDLEDGGITQVNQGPANAMTSDIDGSTIVYAKEGGATGFDIYGYDVDDESELAIDTRNANQLMPAISGNRVVYMDESAGTWDIKLYDIGARTTQDVVSQGAQQVSPSIDGNLVAWIDYRDGASSPNIFARDLVAGSIFRVTDSGDVDETPTFFGFPTPPGV
jgi:beta propeller repeat protein